MGCTTSAEQDGQDKTETSTAREGRQRTALRRASAKGRRYASSEVGSSRASSRGAGVIAGTPRSFRGSSRSDAHDTMLNSEVGASNLIMSQKSSFRSFNFSSPRATPTPRSGVGRPPLPPAPRIVDRRMSVGRFADEPSDPEFRARLAATIEKAKVAHGIDGSVDEITEKSMRQNARVGLTLLGPLGIRRIAAWVDDVRSLDLAQSGTPQASSLATPQAGSALDEMASEDTTPLPNSVSLEADGATSGVQVLHDIRKRGQVVDDDVDMLFLSGGVKSPTPARQQRLSEEALKAAHSAALSDGTAGINLWVTRPQNVS